jgi:hypothetical protein
VIKADYACVLPENTIGQNNSKTEMSTEGNLTNELLVVGLVLTYERLWEEPSRIS